ncbi:MAG: hypothetical protein AMXMBFR84_22220 [Candidatus Hydrogenedentota bacterium]
MDPEAVEKFFHVGQLAFFHLEPRDPAQLGVKCYIRGWQRGSYVLVDMPDPGEHHLRTGQGCSIRFVTDEGCACRFVSKIGDLGSGICFSFARVAWPSMVANMPIRRHQRLAFSCPCTVFSDEATSVPANIIDLSRGGCKIDCAMPFAKDTQLHLSFRLPDGSIIDGIPASVLSISRGKHTQTVRCLFVDPEESHIYDIEFYIASTLARQRGSMDAIRRVLLVEPNEREAERIWVMLRDRGFEAFITHNLVDAFFQLRNQPPAGVLINASMPSVSGVQACRTLRGMRQFKNLPIVIYGPDVPNLKKEAVDAGVTAYVTDMSTARELTSHFADEPNSNLEPTHSHSIHEAAGAADS